MVAPTAASGPVLAARNWKCVPAGMDRQVPGSRDTVSCRRHIRPRPRRMYQISSTQWCATARETWPAPSSKWAHPAAAELQQDADVRAVWRDDIGCPRQLHGVRTLVHDPSALRPADHSADADGREPASPGAPGRARARLRALRAAGLQHRASVPEDLRALGETAGTWHDDEHELTCAHCRHERARLSEVVDLARTAGPGEHLESPSPEVWDRIAAAVAAKTRLLRGLAAGPQRSQHDLPRRPGR